METETRLYRVRDCVYATREEALAAGWPDAEYGEWYSRDLRRVRVGWIALSTDPEDAA